jgi:hypothetical protein
MTEDTNPYRVDLTVVTQQQEEPGVAESRSDSPPRSISEHILITMICTVVSLGAFFMAMFATNLSLKVASWLSPGWAPSGGSRVEYALEVALGILATVVVFIELRRYLLRTLPKVG